MKALELYDYTPEPLQSFTFYPLKDYADEPEIEKSSFLSIRARDSYPMNTIKIKTN